MNPDKALRDGRERKNHWLGGVCPVVWPSFVSTKEGPLGERKPWWVLGALWHGMAAGGSSLLLGPDLTPAMGAGRRWPCSFLHGFRRNLLNSQSRSFEVSVFPRSLSKLSLHGLLVWQSGPGEDAAMGLSLKALGLGSLSMVASLLGDQVVSSLWQRISSSGASSSATNPCHGVSRERAAPLLPPSPAVSSCVSFMDCGKREERVKVDEQGW